MVGKRIKCIGVIFRVSFVCLELDKRRKRFSTVFQSCNGEPACL